MPTSAVIERIVTFEAIASKQPSAILTKSPQVVRQVRNSEQMNAAMKNESTTSKESKNASLTPHSSLLFGSYSSYKSQQTKVVPGKTSSTINISDQQDNVSTITNKIR